MARKTDYYLSQCAIAASKSSMTYHLGAVLVKGGKVISTGYNHHRTHYDGNDILKHGHRKPTSMHAEMHAIFSLTGMSPSFKQQVQLSLRRTAAAKRRPRFETRPTQARRNAPTRQRPPRGWDARRRDSRVNGADIYVARVIKNGLGAAKPCWRCVHWCWWFGVKRIFHWNPVIGDFEVLKVNEGYKDHYETQTDVRLFARLVSFVLVFCPGC
ncbi:hypothetical protein EV702DRAFT_972718 [Suillus placidus]|uniref:CMP/dCMP-type deaminase domain-containing protein n=1 Tax=Suillus placidus TaxID=48579 RepID=A0A9P6ZRX7_9AGAM|nr:hypothetical protein EV702DRAFT_972718 [Suillus placidus]